MQSLKKILVWAQMKVPLWQFQCNTLQVYNCDQPGGPIFGPGA